MANFTAEKMFCLEDIREILLYVQRRIRVDVGHVFPVKINPYWKFNYTFEIFYQPPIKL